MSGGWIRFAALVSVSVLCGTASPIPAAHAESAAFVNQAPMNSAGLLALSRLSGGRPAKVSAAMQLPEIGGLPSQSGNVAIITQRGDNNRSTIWQSGYSNRASVEILSSSGNTTSQTQKGSSNLSGIRIIGGGGNRISTTQVGDRNVGGFTLDDSSGIWVELYQNGNGLNSASAPIKVSSTGSSGGPIVINQR